MPPAQLVRSAAAHEPRRLQRTQRRRRSKALRCSEGARGRAGEQVTRTGLRRARTSWRAMLPVRRLAVPAGAGTMACNSPPLPHCCGAPHVEARLRGAARPASMTASAQLSALLAALCDAPWVTDAVAELHGAGHASLAAQLRALLGPAAGAEACESVVGELWRHAQARRSGCRAPCAHADATRACAGGRRLDGALLARVLRAQLRSSCCRLLRRRPVCRCCGALSPGHGLHHGRPA